MKRFSWLVFAAALGIAASPGAPSRPRGFLGASAAEEEKWEAKFRAGIEPSRIRSSMETLSARPHHVGSEQGRRNAEWMLARFREWGWNADIETFEVLFPTPVRRTPPVRPRRAPRRQDRWAAHPPKAR